MDTFKEGNEVGLHIPIDEDILDDPFSNYSCLYKVLQGVGFPITFRGLNKLRHGITGRPPIGAYTDSPEDLAKIKNIQELVRSTMMLLYLTSFAHVGDSRELVLGKTLTEMFPRHKSNPRVSQEELEKLFMRTYERRIQFNRLSESYADNHMIKPADTELYNQLKSKGAEPMNVEEIEGILRRDVDKVLQEHPDLQPHILGRIESGQSVDQPSAK